jgi:hypothetical protein
MYIFLVTVVSVQTKSEEGAGNETKKINRPTERFLPISFSISRYATRPTQFLDLPSKFSAIMRPYDFA